METHELLEHPVALVLWDARPVVGDGEAHRVALVADVDVDGLLGRRELGGVDDQVHEHVLHRRPVGAHSRQVGLDVELERMIVGERHEVVGQRAQEIVDVGSGSQRGQFLAGDSEPTKVLEVVDEDAELVDLAVHAPHDVETAFVGEELPVIAQHLAVARDDRDQVADLVAEHPQQFVGRKTGEGIVALVLDSHVRRRWSPPATAA